MPAHRIDPEVRFLSSIEFDTNGGCWLWSRPPASTGYGTLWMGGRNVSVHRYSWERAHGPIPQGAGYHGNCVLHKCDVRACVNPDHLFLGTAGENNRDRDLKGRHRGPRGEINGRRKLSGAEVAAIRSLHGNASQREIARKFGVSQPAVSMIMTGKAWA